MKKKKKPIKEGKPNRAEFHHGSTTQGGSNFGQGSNDLSLYTINQGSTADDGANYGNEQGWKNEALRKEDYEDTVPKKNTGKSKPNK